MTNLQKNIPKLRFPEFSKVWDEIKGKDLFTNRRVKGKEGLPIYSVTIDKGLVSRRSLLTKRIENDAKAKANIIAYPQDIAYNMMRMWQGASGLTRQECMVSPAYVVLAPKKNVNSEFYSFLFKSNKYIYKFEAYSYGLTSDRLRLYYKDFGFIKLPYTLLQEQQKIADFLTSVDEKITGITKKVELLKKYKKGVMQKIFSQEIRLRDENGKNHPKWEEKRLGDIAKFSKGSNISKDDITDEGKNEAIRYGELYTTYSEVIKDIKSKTNLDISMLVLSKKNDVIMPASGETHIDIATASCILKDGVALSGDINIIRSNNNGVFLSYYLKNAKKFELAKLAQGVSVIHLYSSNLKGLNLCLPVLEEQKKIADFLTSIDDKIHLEERRLTEARNFKKSLLQQMFV